MAICSECGSNYTPESIYVDEAFEFKIGDFVRSNHSEPEKQHYNKNVYQIKSLFFLFGKRGDRFYLCADFYTRGDHNISGWVKVEPKCFKPAKCTCCCRCNFKH